MGESVRERKDKRSNVSERTVSKSVQNSVIPPDGIAKVKARIVLGLGLGCFRCYGITG